MSGNFNRNSVKRSNLERVDTFGNKTDFWVRAKISYWEKSWKKIFPFGFSIKDNLLSVENDHQNSKWTIAWRNHQKRTYHFVSRTSRYPPWKLPNIFKNQYLRRLFTLAFHDPAFREFWKKRAALGYILLLPFFSCPCCAFFTSLGSVPGPCANLLRFENHQKCLILNCERSGLIFVCLFVCLFAQKIH